MVAGINQILKVNCLQINAVFMYRLNKQLVIDDIYNKNVFYIEFLITFR